MKIRILIVEDDGMIGEEIQEGLSRRGYTVDWVRDMESAATALDLENFSMMILDLGLPDGSGLELLQKMRDGGNRLPVIILTAWDTVPNRINGLDNGADDYMVKPFELEELSARIRALARRVRGDSSPTIRIADLEIDPATKRVSKDGREVRLSHSEYVLLTTFVENVGIVLSRERLEASLYGWEKDVESNAIQVHIHNLREKLGTDIVKNVRGFGYLMDKKR
ncbi:two component transcriptional regulator, winged helix family [Dethiosulfovibrio peptidovorans DSM 11002]|uniref:Two component transcriptional regulator, winged helix family n=1 Tax=Dethiosulfovibrio peptidovorans DSM 11002 TaxID=469381 RepID=D2Z6I5_9BACT|nr:response regulator [Dethiosulfovibrio peptidovorans]EFC91082.1 two component transcriptional regulator, winged helix family [Dethiosulfovibrio peptidovorans DSM 11002]